MSGLGTHELYERWAPVYAPEPHNPLMEVEQQAVLAALPALRDKTVLDLACGTGRYSRLARQRGARQVVALDYSPAMLAAMGAGERVRGDLTDLPLRADAFDVVVAGLALGHASDLVRCMHEIARVLLPGGALAYSDFHPEATRRGLERGFRDATGARFSLPRDGFEVAAHRAALAAAGFRGTCVSELRAGIEMHAQFEGSERFYREWHGTPLVLVVRADAPT